MTATPYLHPQLFTDPDSDSDPDCPMFGVVKWFSPAKGYGFIEKSAPGERLTAGGGRAVEIFVHHSNVSSAGSPLVAGDRVRFELAVGPKGPFAHRVVRS